MSVSLLSTKLHIPPVRSGLVSRTRLLDRMDRGVKGKLTLVSAPAGFGKTTLLSEWIDSFGRPVAWLSLEKGDNDPGRFWSYILAAFRTVQPDLGKNTFELEFSSPQSQIDLVLTSLINQIAGLPDPLLLILDDYQVIDSSPIQEGMTFLLDHMPAQLHLVIASRADPSWPLARWRSGGQLLEIRAADLRFSPQEAADFLNNTMGLGLSAGDITALEERTEGWVAGLQMAALSLQSRENTQEFIDAFTGSNRYIFDYLAEEVLERQPADVQEFLRRTSILDYLSASLCDAILDRAGGHSRAILDRLEKTNLFLTPVDDVRQWYRYHHLFAEILSASLKQSSSKIIPELHRRASAWYEKNGYLPEALIHALDAGDLARLVQLVERYAFTIMDSNEASVFVNWLNALPDAVINSNPWLNIARAWLLAYLGISDEKTIEQAVRKAEAQCEGTDRRLQGFIAAIRTFLGEVDIISVQEAYEQAQKAFEMLPAEEYRARAFVSYHLANLYAWHGNIPGALQALEGAYAISLSAGDLEIAMTARFEIASILRVQGKLKESMQLSLKTLRMPDTRLLAWKSKSLAAAFSYSRRGLIHLEWNELDEALQNAREGIRLCKLWGYSDYLFNAWLIYANILYEMRDLDSALKAIGEAKQFASYFSAASRIYALEALIHLAGGDLARAVAWVEQRGLSPADAPDFSDREDYLAYVRILVAEGKLDEAYRILESLRIVMETTGATTFLLYILTWQAAVLHEQGNHQKALTVLQRALVLAEPEGYIRIFINKGTGLAKLLSKAAATGNYARFAQKLLEEYRQSVGQTGPVKPASTSTGSRKILPPLVEPLSRRELEILRLLASSLSNPEIARELYLSVGTVRTHVKNIYRKLDVNRRMEAVQRARELGVI